MDENGECVPAMHVFPESVFSPPRKAHGVHAMETRPQRAARQIEAEREAAGEKARAARGAAGAGEEVMEGCSDVAALKQTPSAYDNANTRVKGAVARAGAGTRARASRGWRARVGEDCL